jgi:hypothetical protein
MVFKPQVKYADLNEDQLKKVTGLEKELGTAVVAYELDYKLSELSPAQLEKLQALEKELGLVLLSFDAK